MRKRRYRVPLPTDTMWTRAKGALLGKRIPAFPESVLLETVTSCNARCVFCSTQEARKGLPTGAMAEALFRKIVAECAQHRDEVKRFSFAFDNEPLLDRDLVRRVAQVKAALPDVTTNITTNGILLTRDRVAELYDSGAVDEINVSVQGITRETHEKLMGVPTFDRVMENLEHLARVHRAAARRPVVEINTCLTPETIRERPEAERRWAALGFRSHYIPLDSRAGAQGRRGRPYFEYCRRPFHSMVICFDGVVPLCCADYRRSCPVGDVSRESMADVWNGPAMQTARAEMTSGAFDRAAICRTCEMADDGG